MAEETTFTDAVVACLLHNAPADRIARYDAIVEQVQSVLGENGKALPKRPDRNALQQELNTISDLLSTPDDHIALIAGGATKIKGYVFEAPKLPEIRGASALLDWVNDTGLRDLWRAKVGEAFDNEVLHNLWRDKIGKALDSKELAAKCIIYASGGGFLAFAPAALGAEMAAAVEHCYTEHTLTANSVAVWETFSLLELRYGRLVHKHDTKELYWVEDFIDDCKDARERLFLKHYYYELTDKIFQEYDALRDKLPRTTAEEQAFEQTLEALRHSFFQRKTFGELVTLLATMTNRRRDERAAEGDARSVPFYQVLPWAEMCDSSGVRPAIVRIAVGDETEPREMSEASARKRIIGQFVKDDEGYKQLAKAIQWAPPHGLKERAWNNQWLRFLEKHPEVPYAKMSYGDARPAGDVHEIGGASSGYIGIIYADGNNVGRLIATLKTPKDYHDRSLDLSDAAIDAVLLALAKHLEPTTVWVRTRGQQHETTALVHPFEILTIGGDDLFIIVPGSKALDIALEVAKIFESSLAAKIPPSSDDAKAIDETKGRYDTTTDVIKAQYKPSIGLSAGVIVAQENAPIFFLRDLVEELLKSAKGLAKENVKNKFYGGAVDFMVMKSITMVTDKIKSFRRQALGDDGKDSVRRLTARPYTWHEFAGLLDTVRALKKARVPRSQLYRLRRALDADAGSAITPSVMEYLYTRVRMQRGYSDALQTYIEQHWCWSTPVPQRSSGLPPWMPLGKGEWETIWPDMLEAYEMVPEQIEEPR